MQLPYLHPWLWVPPSKHIFFLLPPINQLIRTCNFSLMMSGLVTNNGEQLYNIGLMIDCAMFCVEHRPRCITHKFSNHNTTTNNSMDHHLPPWVPLITMAILCKHQGAHSLQPNHIAYQLDPPIYTTLHPWKALSLLIVHHLNCNNFQ